MTNAEARFNKSLRPRKPEGSLGRTAQDVHLDSHTAPELCLKVALKCYTEDLVGTAQTKQTYGQKNKTIIPISEVHVVWRESGSQLNCSATFV